MACNSGARSPASPLYNNGNTYLHRRISSYPIYRAGRLAQDVQSTMDPLVYEDSPLATYFEGEAIPYAVSREITPPHTPFAPNGLGHIKKRLRRARKASISVSSTSTEQLLERFRYVIVASQLLSDETGPRATTSDDDLSEFDATSVTGAILTATLSFVAAWAIHWLRTRRKALKAISWFDVGVYSFGILVVGTGATFLAQQLYVKHIQKSAVQTLSRLIDHSRSLDNTANSTVRFIQEVEVVARGYDLTAALPPISRLEERQSIRRCQTLRSEIAGTLKVLTTLLVQSHNAIQPHISDIDLQRYHDIYEISLVEYSQAIELVKNVSEQASDSLKELRFAFRLHALARKVFLCDLLALKQPHGVAKFRQWTHVLRILQDIESETKDRQQRLAQSLCIEEWGAQQKRSNRSSMSLDSQADSDVSAPENQTLKSQTRRFDEVANSIRALNAKVHIVKEELSGLTNSNTEDMVISAAMLRHYESLGTDIRHLIVEWEKGRNTMLLNADPDRAATMTAYSRSPSSIRSPISPATSLGNGLTIIDGSPAEALHLLNGDFDPYTSMTPVRKSLGIDLPEEEIFEAMSKPLSRSSKRMSVSGMSREEKIAKLQEDRRKRVTLQEQQDNTTSMLRELRMVIKHRPIASLGAAGPAAAHRNASDGNTGTQPRVLSM